MMEHNMKLNPSPFEIINGKQIFNVVEEDDGDEIIGKEDHNETV